MTEKFLTIPFEQIVDSKTFTIHSFLEKESATPELAKSIQQYGILTPPTVIDCGNSTFDVICGRKRLFCAASLLNKQNCLCRVLPCSTEKKSILLLLLEEQFTYKELTLIEQAEFLTLCRSLIVEKEEFKYFWQSLPSGRITKGLHYLDNFIQLNEPVKRKIHYSVLSEKTADDLRKFNQTDQLLLIDLIETLQLGLNNQKKIVHEMREAICRQQISLASFLHDISIQEIIADPTMNQSQKTSKLFNHLNALNHPLLSRAIDSFSRRVSAMNLPKNWRLTHAKSFEKDEVELTIRFKNLDSFEKSWPNFKTAISEK